MLHLTHPSSSRQDFRQARGARSAKRPPQSGGLRQSYVEVIGYRYLQSERAASSATTTQLVCSCRIEAGHWGVTGP